MFSKRERFLIKGIKFSIFSIRGVTFWAKLNGNGNLRKEKELWKFSGVLKRFFRKNIFA